jgi:hypothetical protein
MSYKEKQPTKKEVPYREGADAPYHSPMTTSDRTVRGSSKVDPHKAPKHKGKGK